MGLFNGAMIGGKNLMGEDTGWQDIARSESPNVSLNVGKWRVKNGVLFLNIGITAQQNVNNETIITLRNVIQGYGTKFKIANGIFFNRPSATATLWCNQGDNGRVTFMSNIANASTVGIVLWAIPLEEISGG